MFDVCVCSWKLSKSKQFTLNLLLLPRHRKFFDHVSSSTLTKQKKLFCQRWSRVPANNIHFPSTKGAPEQLISPVAIILIYSLASLSGCCWCRYCKWVLGFWKKEGGNFPPNKVNSRWKFSSVFHRHVHTCACTWEIKVSKFPNEKLQTAFRTVRLRINLDVVKMFELLELCCTLKQMTWVQHRILKFGKVGGHVCFPFCGGFLSGFFNLFGKREKTFRKPFPFPFVFPFLVCEILQMCGKESKKQSPSIDQKGWNSIARISI